MLGVQNITDSAMMQKKSSSENSLNRLNNKGSFKNELENTLNVKSGSKANPKIDKKLMETCQEAESLFVSKMFKEMRKTVHKGDWLHGGFAEDIFEDMLYDEYSLDVSKNYNLGMAKLLYDEMSRKL